MFEFHETTIAPLVECPTATGKSFWAPGQTSPPRMPGEVRSKTLAQDGAQYSDNPTFRKEFQHIVDGARTAGLPER
jgi:hypothetical protein